MRWMGQTYPTARVFRLDSGQAYAKHTVKAALQEYKRTKSITASLKRLITITYGVEGWPDLLVIFMGIAYGIEVKLGKDKQRDSQKSMEFTFNICGAAYRIVDDKAPYQDQIIPVMETIKRTMEKI